MYVLGLIIVIIILLVKNNKLTKELESLKKGIRVEDLPVKEEVKEVIKEEKIIEAKKKEIPKKIETKHNDREIKNSLILITGSILVVLAALLFLTSTWEATHNTFKTFMICAMLVIFLVAKYIAQKINLTQTAKAFYYIALAYIPIIFLSIFLFELFGTYLSINGEGSYIYLTCSFLILTAIYYITSKKSNNNLVIAIASFISIVLAVLFGVAIFTEELGYFVLGLVVFSILYNIMYQKDFYCISREFHLYSLFAIIGSTTLLILYSNILVYLFTQFQWFDIVGQLLMLYNVYALFSVILKKEKLFILIYPLYFIYVIFNMTTMFDGLLFHQLYMIGAFVIVYLFEMLRYGKVNTSSFLEVFICNILLSVVTMSEGNCIDYLNVSTILCISSGFALLKYLTDDSSRKYIPYYILTPLIFAACDLANYQDVSLMYVCLIGLVYLAVSFVLNENEFTRPLRIIGTSAFMTFMFCANNNIWEVLLLLGFVGLTFLFNYIKNDHVVYRIISYIYTNVLFIEFIRLFNIENEELVLLCIPFVAIVLCALPYVLDKIYDEANHIYMMVQFIVSLAVLCCIDVTWFGILFLIAVNGLYIMHIKEHNYNNNFRYVSLASFMPFLFFKDLISNECIMSALIFLSIVYLVYCIYKKKANMYIVAAYLYLCCYDENKYILLFVFTLITLASYLAKENKIKDLFKAALYVCPVILLEMIFEDLGLGDAMAFTITPVLIVIPIIARDIIKKYSPNFKIFEYILFGLFNLIATSNFLDQSDGLTFVFILTVFVVVSYLMKIGPVFIVSLIAIVIDIFILTEEFWLNLPWWLYVLVVGSVLIGFAVHNELKTTKSDKKLIAKLKDNLDL